METLRLWPGLLLSILHLLQEEWVLKNSSISLVIMETQRNTEMSFFTCQSTDFLDVNAQDRQGGREASTPALCWRGCKLVQLLEDLGPTCIINLKFCICMSLGFFFSSWENRKLNSYWLDQTYYLTRQVFKQLQAGHFRSPMASSQAQILTIFLLCQC